MRTITLAAALSITAGLCHADVKTAAIIGSNMVLQQNGYAPIWGWADPKEEVSVQASWATGPTKTVADATGKWMVRLKTPPANELKSPGKIVIKGKNTIVCDNVVLGEVWLCSGQSNMEWPVAASMNAPAEIAAANHPMIRYFSVVNEVSPGVRSDCKGEWKVMSPKTAGECTAVGYFFAREINKTLDVPVGLIASDWGGTPVESWTSGSALASVGEYADVLAELNAIDADPSAREKKLAERADAWWKNVDANPKAPGAGWAGPAFDDAAWKTLAVPGAWSGEIANFDGFLYMRKSFELLRNESGKSATLDLAAIDDRDDAWVNGTWVGSMHAGGVWNTPRSYAVPAGLLKEGKNVVAVRVRDDQGQGGVLGDAAKVALRIGDQTIPLAGDWKYVAGPTVAESPIPPMIEGVTAWTPTALYNAMIHPIRHYAIKGALWYQGESNRGRSEQYMKVFGAMIRGWREDWALGDFPFYFVQLAPFNYGNDPGLTAEIRDVQTATLDAVPNTGMACTMDIGNPGDIHPANKQDVGKRLALWALAKDYGKTDVVFSGPVFEGIKVDGDSILVRLSMGGSAGLVSKDGAPKFFHIAGEDKVFYRAQATIEGSSIRVKRQGISKPVAVRYAWEGACMTNLFNVEGLPVVPFRSDDWERPQGGWPGPKE